MASRTYQGTSERAFSRILILTREIQTLEVDVSRCNRIDQYCALNHCDAFFRSIEVIAQPRPDRCQSREGFDTGIEIRPHALPGLLATLDAYRINLNGSIESPGDESVLQECAKAIRSRISRSLQYRSQAALRGLGPLFF
jgi:hypothetical protein